MRLLSIFALLFLISFFLHRQAQEQGDEVAPGEAVATAQTPDEAAPAEPPPPPEDFSALIFEPPYPSGHFEFERETAFSAIEPELKNLLARPLMDDSYKTTNHFCAVGYVIPRDRRAKAGVPRKEVVIYWREGQTLYRWTGGNPRTVAQDFIAGRSSIFSSRTIALFGDAPDNGDRPVEDKSASFRDNADNTIADCDKHGKRYTVEPFKPPPRGFTPVLPPTAPRPNGAPRAADAPPDDDDDATPPRPAKPAPKRAAPPSADDASKADSPTPAAPAPAAAKPAPRPRPSATRKPANEPTIRAWTPPPDLDATTPAQPAKANSDPISDLLAPKPAAPPATPAPTPAPAP